MPTPLVLVFDISAGTQIGTSTTPVPVDGDNADQFYIDWGDGSNNTGTPFRHTYGADISRCVVTISGEITRFGTFLFSPEWGQVHLTECISFCSTINNLKAAFMGATNLKSVPSTIPPNVTNTSLMFLSASSFNQDLSGWDVSGITDMNIMFGSALSFNNGDTGNNSNKPLPWNTKSVSQMQNMFNGASAFNQNINRWDVRGATLNGMFYNALAFNQDISGWNVSNTRGTYMSYMLSGSGIDIINYNSILNGWAINPTGSRTLGADGLYYTQDGSGAWNTLRSNGWNITGDYFVSPTINPTTIGQGILFTLDLSYNQPGTNPVIPAGTYQLYDSTNSRVISSSITLLNSSNNLQFTDVSVNMAGSLPIRLRTTGGINVDGFNLTVSSPPPKLVLIFDISAGTQIGTSTTPVPVSGPNSNEIYIDWGDGSNNKGTPFRHTYGADIPGCIVTISGEITQFGEILAWGQRYLTDCSSFCDTITNLGYAFFNASRLRSVPSTLPPGVTDMIGMFSNASVFNQDLSGWDVSACTNMSYMFSGASLFNNGDNSNNGRTPLVWNTYQVGNMAQMFLNASKFNQDLSGWNVSACTNMINMLNGSGIDVIRYNSILNGWASRVAGSQSRTLGAGGLYYTQDGSGAWNTLRSNGWAIIDDNFVSPIINPNTIGQGISFTFDLSYNQTGTNPVIPAGTYQLYDSTNSRVISSSTTLLDPSNNIRFTDVSVNITGSLPIRLRTTGGINVDGFNLTVDNSCFKEDTKILTNNGWVAIQDLKIGDLVKTPTNGYMPIYTIGYSYIFNEANNVRIKDRLYALSKNDYTELFEDLVLTGGHSILVDELTDEQKVGTLNYFDTCTTIDGKYQLLTVVNERAKPYQESGTFKVYHFALDSRDERASYGVYANGLLAEACSLHYLKNMSGMTLIDKSDIVQNKQSRRVGFFKLYPSKISI